MLRRGLRRITRSTVAMFSAMVLLAGGMAVSADEIMLDDSDDGGSVDVGGSIEAGDYSSDSAFLIEDTGEDVQYNAGVPMDTLQDAMSSGDTKTLEKIASLGALTGSTTTSGSGIGGGGAYRGSPDDEDEDDEDYYDLQLDEGDADEVETDADNSERPGRLIAANADRIQEYLDSMTQVESPTGSDGELTVAAYIETKMGEMGYTVQEQAFHEGVLNEDGVDAPGVNILAERGANSQTNRKRDIFLVVTHYDSKRSPAEDDPFANDKSGAAALIESARILSEVVTDTDICYLFLSGEEDGGYGAQNFIASLSPDNRSRISGVLSVERVGYDSDTPYVLKTLTGERNAIGDIVQQLGITNDAHLALQEPAEDSDEDDGTWVGVGESSDGYIDDNTAQQIAAEQAGGGAADDHSIDIDTSEFLEDSGEDAEDGDMELDEAETEGEPVPMPSAWSYLKDSSPTLTCFAGESFMTVGVSQYMPQLDSASYKETIALGLADTTQGAVEQASELMAGQEGDTREGAAQGTVELQASNLTGSSDEVSVTLDDALSLEGGSEEDGAEVGEIEQYDADYPVVDASLVADTTNVIAAALAQIMDPTT
ncbi:MAG: M28 family peptidase [Lachnospiraceae bacterium]|nr:M28 family peptidase [Lachnospiraceae bacterium]